MARRQSITWISGLLLIYGVVALGTLLIWQVRDVYLLVGDEPHYLVMAKSVAEFGTLDQLLAYRAELADPVIFAQTMEPLDPTLSSPGTQTFINEAGMFSVHAPGLGLLLALPLLIGGVLGAKLALIAIGGLVVPATWLVTGVFSSRPTTRGAITLVTAIACPLLFSVGQVYPDVPAGVIILLALARLLTMDRRLGSRVGARIVDGLIAAGLAFLPWLQLKFSAPALILVAALAWQWRRTRRSLALLSVVVVLASVAALAAFNTVAYGSFTGAYVDGGLVANATALMVLLGLLLDQNQGLLMLNPALWLAVPGVVLLWRSRRSFAVVWSVVVASLLIPNAMHPNWYGGGSFIGRFALAASLAFVIPAAAALAALRERYPRAFWPTVAASVFVQLLYWCWYALISGIQPGYSSGLDLYNKPADTWLESYTVFGFPVERFLPALYDANWALGYAPNLVWILGTGTVVVLVLLALRSNAQMRLWVPLSALAFVAAVVASGLLSSPGTRSVQERASQLASQTGTEVDGARIASRGVDGPAFITVGPQVSMRQGPYAITIDYRSSAPPDVPIGRLELADAATNTVLRSQEISGTLDAPGRLEDGFAYRSLTPQVLEVRVAWYGIGTLVVDSVAVRNAQS